jgi:hypothetical protein
VFHHDVHKSHARGTGSESGVHPRLFLQA